ncbi:recombinase family protein [Listeria monocytogenes]|uniref:recombinase family protein n=1 Tax=Vagococcus fluvialis TaxID=2738 RepID=UPI0029E8C427|nr:recombinase family protein [Listeria monocytogenes]EKS1414075.1 recombinase family protein [Listeria monocytogenes]EKS1429166.1 recombinase family protein [Listeria monocytogenes]EKS1441197.1 recombinase family protein [Listeria monocytogenes]EKS1562682.1 recombinase family protein [Listeria monocytogenes]
MTIFGYTRVSTSNQDYQTQIQKLENAGAEKIFSETYTGTKKEGRNELRHLQDAIEKGDQVLVTKIDRLARSIVDLNSIVSSLNEKGVTVTFLDNSLTFEPDKKDSMQTLMMNMLGSFAQLERDLIVTRTQEEKQWHKANNKNYREGRPKRVLNDRYKHELELMKTHSMREVVKMTDISLSTLKRIKKQAREEED